MCSMWTRLGAEAEEAEAVEAKELAQEASCERKSKHWKGGKEEEITRDKKEAHTETGSSMSCSLLKIKSGCICTVDCGILDGKYWN